MKHRNQTKVIIFSVSKEIYNIYFETYDACIDTFM